MEAIVATERGKVRGRLDDGVAVFLGIPYAAPPFGPHRFGAPVEPEPWEGVRDALEFGPTAPKRPYRRPLDRLIPDPDIPGDGCLNLNVWTPEGADGLPVMVWIHGGSLRNGSSSVPVYDGRAFARDGIVLVSINYRLGVEGFAVFPDAPANRGLLDQLAALRWVRDNIAAFGGDPGNVTVFGESAGAISIGALLTSPRSAGLFRRAVLQSGPPHAVPSEAGARITRVIARGLGIAPTAAAFAAVDRERLLTAQAEATAKGNPISGGAGFEIVLDGDVVPAHPMDALKAGVARDVDLLLGANTEEYRLWFVPTGVVDRIGGLTLRLAMAKFKIKGSLARLYRANRPGARPGEILGALATDLLLRVPLNRLADARAGGGNTYMYEFGWRSPVDGLGACHALEIGFVFDTLRTSAQLALAGPEAPQELADAMHRAWIAFAVSGDPGWPVWDRTRPVMLFDHPGPDLVRAPRDDELRRWR
ncbi:carboxylesterase family protein [Streptosporangium sp. NPDC001681]|uniref:carboxylesterase/lipase family protein n=1 Tax=Streptosporangium sp. NPDC001681 TaxID=3154395 RepID=UPI003327B4CE